MASSMSETEARPRGPAEDGGVCPVAWADGRPVLTVVVPHDPVVCGPDVAPMWPQCLGTTMARPVRMTVLGRGSDGRQLGRWVRPDQGDTSLVGKGRRPAAARPVNGSSPGVVG